MPFARQPVPPVQQQQQPAASHGLQYRYPGVIQAPAAPVEAALLAAPAAAAAAGMAAGAATGPAAAVAGGAAAALSPFPCLGTIGSFVSLLGYMELGVLGGGQPFNQREQQGSKWRKGKKFGKRWAELKAGFDEIAELTAQSGVGSIAGQQKAAAELDAEAAAAGKPFATFLKGVVMRRRTAKRLAATQ